VSNGIETRGNENYAATIVQVRHLEPLEGLDNLAGLRVLGFQALVPKDTPIGSLMVVFGAETQLSESFASANNLFRHSELNADPDAKGYLEDNRRVKAIKMRGHRSDALALPLDSLAFFLNETAGMGPALGLDLPEGTVFDHLEGHEVCRKYIVPGTKVPGSGNQTPKKQRVSARVFPEHYDTTNGWRNSHLIPSHAYVTVTQKLHGTSVRFGNVLVEREKPLRWWERLLTKVGVPVPTTERAFVVGSRRVTKSVQGVSKSGDHFYGEGDIFTEAVSQYAEVIPKDFLVFGEIVGYTPEGQPIQPKYTYNLAPGRNRLYVYRVATVNEDGNVMDLPWEAVKQFCRERGMEHVPQLWSGFYDMALHLLESGENAWIDTRHADTYNGIAVPLSDKGTVDEGVVVRADLGYIPTALKFKSPIFLGHETKMLDAGEVDTESAESVE
jgi:hypothetical protein